MPLTTTDVDTIRASLAALVERIVPRRPAGRDFRWTYTPDQEICGTLRTFDVVMAEEDEVIDDGSYGEGIQYKSETRIVVSYPVSLPERRRFVGSDSQDLACILVRLQSYIDGVFPLGMNADRAPIFAKEISGNDGSYVVAYVFDVHFYASDTVTLE